jgi:hypothetical protein
MMVSMMALGEGSGFVLGKRAAFYATGNAGAKGEFLAQSGGGFPVVNGDP